MVDQKQAFRLYSLVGVVVSYSLKGKLTSISLVNVAVIQSNGRETSAYCRYCDCSRARQLSTILIFLAIRMSDSRSSSSSSICEVLTFATKHIISKPTRGKVISVNPGREGGASVASGSRSMSLMFSGSVSLVSLSGKDGLKPYSSALRESSLQMVHHKRFRSCISSGDRLDRRGSTAMFKSCAMRTASPVNVHNVS